MWESPIELIHGDMHVRLENEIVKAVQSYGIKVDKNELIKALNHDREQYERGYEDAKQMYKRPKGKWESRDGFYGVAFCSECDYDYGFNNYY